MAKHDPVAALREADATGLTAEIFEDIRQTMQLPLLTSIWRILAADESTLESVWNATKPIFVSGLPMRWLAAMDKAVALPLPSPIVAGQLEAAGLMPGDVNSALQVLNVYNRSNSLNFLGLSALVFDVPIEEKNVKPALVPLTPPPLPPLLEASDMPASRWQFLQALNQFGASPDEPGLATVWRHLAHWPGLLAVIHSACAPLQSQGNVSHVIQEMLTFVQTKAERSVPSRQNRTDIPDQAWQTITRYVTHPGLVIRMVAMGRILSTWLAEAPEPFHLKK